MRNAKTIMLIAAVAALVAVAGCQKVSVVDQQGDPIAFAKIQITSHGGEGTTMPAYTDMLGSALLPTNLAEPDARETLIVSKDGYGTRSVNRIKDSDMTVTLQAMNLKSTKPVDSDKKTSDSKESKED